MKKIYTIVLIISSLILITSFIFKGNITGNTILSSSINDPLYDYLIIIVIGLFVASAIGMNIIGRQEQRTEEELNRFDVSKSRINLERYVKHCKSQGRNDTDIKNALKKGRLDKNLINDSLGNQNRRG